MDVLPHPHVGLQTVTYLYSGAIEHRDCLGSVQVIRLGFVLAVTNKVLWLTPGWPTLLKVALM